MPRNRNQQQARRELFNEWTKHPVTKALFEFFGTQESTARTILGTSPWASKLRQGKLSSETAAYEQMYYSTLADEYYKLRHDIDYETLFGEESSGEDQES